MSRTERLDGLAALQTSPEFQSPVESLEGHESNEHLALIYESRDEQFATVVPFVRQGLERGERCMYIADDNTRQEVLAALRVGGVDVGAALESGALSIHTVEETYREGGAFDADDGLDLLESAMETANEEFAGFRVTAEETWLVENDEDVEEFMTLEACVNDTCCEDGCLALCQYNREKLPPAVIEEVVETHPYLIYDNTICQNFYYTPPEEYFGPEQPGRDLDRKLRTLVDRTEARARLESQTRDLHRLNEIVADPDRGFEEKLGTLFELGTEQFGLELGAMARVDPERDRFEVERVSRDHDRFEPGFELPLSETYCSVTAEAQQTTGVTDPDGEGFDDVTVYEDYGIRAYLGTHVAIEDGDDRTLFFVSSEPRRDPFSEDEQALVELMGQWAKYELERRRNERELERHREYTDDLLDAIDDLFYVLDEEYNLRRWNESLSEVMGLPDGELESMPALDAFEGEDAAAVEDSLEEVFETGSAQVEAELLTADGESIPYEFAASALEDPSGDPVVVGIGRDVSERTQMEGQLRRERDLKDEVVETSPTGIVVTDETGEISLANSRAEEILTTSGEDLTRFSLDSDRWDPRDENGDPIGETELPFRRIADGETERTNEVLSVERTDDERIWLSVTGAPITDDDGDVERIVFSLRDVTDRKERERELELFRSLIDGSNDGVFVIDPDTGRFLDVNDTACRRLGYDRAELLELTVTDIEREATEPGNWDDHVELIRDRGGMTFEGIHERRDGTTNPVEVSVDHVELDEEYVLAVVRDITERKERERFLRDLYDVTAALDLTFEEKIEEMLELGQEWFDLDVGYFAAVDPAADEFEVVRAVGSHPRIQTGVEGPLTGTYCEKVVDENGPVNITNATAEGLTDDPAYNTFGLEAYLGTPLEVDGELYGTLCVGSETARDEPFSETDGAFLDLMSRWISYELERGERERYLRELYQITAAPEDSFEDKIGRLLDLGRERFDLEMGFFLEHDGDRFRVVETRGTDLEAGTATISADPGQYCNEAISMNTPLGVEDAAAAGWDDDPRYEEYDLRCYLGTRVTDGTGVFGTVVFADSTVRESEFTDAEYTFLELIGQWTSQELEQERHETRLAALNELSRGLMNAETHAEVAEATVGHAQSSLDLPVTAVVGYDDETGELSPLSQTPRSEDELPIARLCTPGSGPFWDVFVSDEERVVVDPAEFNGAGDDLTSAIAFPLAEKGLLVTATEAPGGFAAPELDFLETTAATIEAACARVDREQKLQQRESVLEEQNETLERLNRVNDIIRTIDKALVQASTREEIERIVCEKLADEGPYELAWVGEHDPVTEEILPQEWAGAERGYLEEVTVTDDDDPTGMGPVGRATRTHEPQVVNDILQDRSFEPWRQAALNRGYHACLSLPLAYQDTLYGVLTVYADKPNVFDDLEEAVLAEMSDNIAYAINAVESKRALVSDEVTQLEFSVPDPEFELVELARETGCEVSLESLVPQADAGVRAFVSTRGVPAEDVLEFAPRMAVTDVTPIAEQGEDDETVCLFEFALDEGSLGETVLDHGGRLQAVEVADGAARVVVHLASDADVREFVEMFRRNYPDAELIAQQTREQPTRTFTGFRTSLIEDLTARQLETLQRAYFSGYFEQPRTRTASEIAETMDISQPTFNSHLRTAQRKLCRQLFEESMPA